MATDFWGGKPRMFSASSGLVSVGALKVNQVLLDTVNRDVLSGSGVDAATFWASVEAIVRKFAPRNKELLRKRDTIQAQIDAWHLARKGKDIDMPEYKAFLTAIGYLVPASPDVLVQTALVDDAIAVLSGPQLVVPVDNARYALNAANARWGSLLDAMYGTDAVTLKGDLAKGREHNVKRAAAVLDKAELFLDAAVPLDSARWSDVTSISVDASHSLLLKVGDKIVALAAPAQYAGHAAAGAVQSVLFRNHGLHIELQIDGTGLVGKTQRAQINDVILESAISTICDCEDSVAAVDAEDKARVYSNWSGLMQGKLTTAFAKGAATVQRGLNADKHFTAPDGSALTLAGRSHLLVRNVGIHMYTDAVQLDGDEVPEGILDALVTVAAARHDLAPAGRRNSKVGSVYIVKPKMHGPDEVRFVVDLFADVEKALDLPPNTIKIGIMDEERRTTVNLLECINQAKDRVIFINTGFLDRTGDEIHTSMEAGPVLPKAEIKLQPWIRAYEDWNVDVGIATRLHARGQIGKGMWAAPDNMAAMLKDKIAHPEAGASVAWVPSPTAATLHAIHYHAVDVADRQAALTSRLRASLDDILTPPLLPRDRTLSKAEVQSELDNNAQGILGYVVRWIDHGVGCSKVPDIKGTELMEDRATLRISSQHIANWLHHGLITKDDVHASFQKMAKVVDEQNAKDPTYVPMAPSFAGVAYHAALDLCFEGRTVANGYTEFTLTKRRREKKALDAAGKS